MENFDQVYSGSQSSINSAKHQDSFHSGKDFSDILLGKTPMPQQLKREFSNSKIKAKLSDQPAMVYDSLNQHKKGSRKQLRESHSRDRLSKLTDIQEFHSVPYVGLIKPKDKHHDYHHKIQDFNHQYQLVDHTKNKSSDAYSNSNIYPPRAQTAINNPSTHHHKRAHSEFQNLNSHSRKPSMGIKFEGNNNNNSELAFIKDRVHDSIHAFDQYKQNHLKRLDTFKKQIVIQHKDTNYVRTEQMVDKEIQLLRKVRQMNTDSYKNRIKTGGNLISNKSKSIANSNNIYSNLNNSSVNNKSLVSSTGMNPQTEQNSILLQKEDIDLFKKHFKHKPKYPLKVQSLKHSSRASQQIIHTQNTNDHKPKTANLHKRNNLSQQNTSIQNTLNLNIDFNKLKSDQDVDQIKKENFKSLMIYLPVVLAKNAHDKLSIDSLYFKATNLIYKHQYEQALQFLDFDHDIYYGMSQQQTEMCLFNKAYCLFKMGEQEQALQYWSQISFYQYQILSQFNTAVINLLDQQWEKAFISLDYCMQQIILGFMKIEWVNQSEFIRKCYQIYKEIKNQVKKLKDDDDVSSNYSKRFKELDQFFVNFIKPQEKHLQISNLTTFRGRSISVLQEVNADVQSQTSQAPSIQIGKARSSSMASDYEAFSASYYSPKRDNPIQDFQSRQKVKQAQSITQNKEYFPMPFENSKRISEGSQLKQVRVSKAKKSRHLWQNSVLQQQQELNYRNPPAVNSLDIHVQEVSFISQENLEKLVYKPYNNISIEQPDQPNGSYVNKSKFQPKQQRKERKLSKASQQQKEIQEVLKKSSVQMQLIQNEIDLLEQLPEEDQEETESQIEAQDQVQTENSLGLPISQPVFLDKKKSLMLDRILGLIPGAEMTDEERIIAEKRKQIEKDFMIDRVIDQMTDDNEDNKEQAEKNQQKTDFLMENFFKIYDRPPTNKETIEQPSNPESIKHSRKTSSIGGQQQHPIKTKHHKSSQGKRGSVSSKNRSIQHEDDDDQNNLTYKKRLRMTEVDKIVEFIRKRGEQPIQDEYSVIDRYVKKLDFFAKYPYEIRKQLINECDLQISECGDTIFHQGDPSPQFFVLLRGSVKAILIKKDYGNIPICINTYYDGKEFGEVNLYEASDNLTLDMVQSLNKQKYTCESMELSHLAILNKALVNKIINQNLQSNFERRIAFLKEIDIFKHLEMHVLLPLANNLRTETFRLGEYILKEGQQPKGLYMIIKGQCKVGSEKLNMRAKQPLEFSKLKKQIRNFKFKGNFHDLEDLMEVQNIRVDTKQDSDDDNMESAENLNQAFAQKLGQYKLNQQKRLFQNDRIYYDESGKKIKDHIVYKDYMNFFTLTVKDYFGGKVLLVNETSQNHDYSNTSDINDDSTKKKNKIVYDDHSLLSVIADSSEVELLVMDRTQLSFFPEKVQKEIYHLIENAFQPDKPYESAIVDKIKDKFREWEKYKLETVNSILKQAYAERKKGSILNINR